MSIHPQLFSKSFLLTVAAAFLGACGIVINRLLLVDGENPLNLVLWIGLFAAIPWLVIFFQRRQEFVALTPRYKWGLVIIGVASSIGIQYLQSLALANTSATNFAFLYRTVTVFTIVFAAIFLKEKITRHKWVLAGLILIGSYLLTAKGQQIILSKGDIYSLLMAASAALIANILIKHTISKMHPDLSGAVVQVVATCSLLTLSLSTKVFYIPQNMGLILLGGVIAFMQIALRNRAYQTASASFVSMMYSLSPLFVALLSYPLLRERLSPIEMIGGVIIIGAAFAAEKFKV